MKLPNTRLPWVLWYIAVRLLGEARYLPGELAHIKRHKLWMYDDIENRVFRCTLCDVELGWMGSRNAARAARRHQLAEAR